MAEQGITKRQESTPAMREEMRSQRRYLTPAVDIFETDEKLVLVADMPGVDKDGLDVSLEKGILTLKGEMKSAKKGQLLFHEFSSDNYYRQFKLSEEIDMEKASAELKDGVLTLTMPKSEAAKPRRIEIKH
ncbi:MAG TPA: Hsp20/alpha crystallin family protein [Geopsychrobacteraceae bacterium]|nr:Hsp20/alpha crystallin family protein [Geopsychrobacteraceae bacterium]